jgi:pectinesterase
MWGDGPCYFIRGHFYGLKNGSSFTQPRNPATHHGFVYVDSTFDAADGVDRALLGNGSGSSEVALINCVLGNAFPPTGWAGRGAAHNAEFHLTKLSDGTPYDTSQWPASVRHFDKEKDAETIANYRNPTWVLGGWTPALAPLILTPPSAATAASGQPAKLAVVAAGILAGTYQWQRNGAPLKDGNGVSRATTDTLVIANATAAAAGNYAVTMTNASGAATSVPVALSVSR